MTTEAIRQALIAPNEQDRPFGEVAGDAMMQLGADRGLDSEIHNVYDVVTHHACIADLIVSAIRKPDEKPWLIPDPVQNWTSGCFLSPSGDSLRRVVLVSHWSESRQRSECRGWSTLGEIAHYQLPMQLVVAIIGQEKNGKRRSAWATGFQHPKNKQLRFRKKGRATSEVFNERWVQIWREDHAEITRETWLQGMLTDDVLPEILFRVDIPILENTQRQKVLDLAKRRLDRLSNLEHTPEPQLSTCEFPVPCQFRRCCHGKQECEPSEKQGFIRLVAWNTPIE